MNSKIKAFAFISFALMVGGAFLCCSVFTDDSEAAPPPDRTAIIGSEDCPLTYYYGYPALKTTYHVYLAAGSFLSIHHSSQGVPNAVSGTSEVSVVSYTMSNGVNTKKVEGTVNNIGDFTVSSSRAKLQSYDPGDIIIHVVQPKSLMLDPEQPFSMTLVSIDPAFNPGTDYFGYSEGPDWITETYDGSSEILSGTAPSSPGTYTESFYANSTKEYKYASINITVRDIPKHTVTYNANGGSCSTPSVSVYTGSSTVLPSAFRTGYTFSGWYTASSGGTGVGGAGSSYTVNADTILYAQWSQNTLTASAANGEAVSNQATGIQISAVANNEASLSYVIKSCSAGTASVSGGGLVTFKAPTVSATTTCNVVVTVTATYPDGQTSSVDTAFSVTVDPVLVFTNSVTNGTLSIKGVEA